MKIELDDMAVILADSVVRVKNVLDEEMPKDDVEFFMGIVGATIWDALQHAYDQRGFEVAKGFNPDDGQRLQDAMAGKSRAEQEALYERFRWL